MKNLLKIFILGILLLPTSSFAFDLQSGAEVYINNDSDIKENLYLLGAHLNFDKIFDNDVFMVGGNSIAKGVLFGDLQIFSVNSLIEGEFFGDTRIISFDSTINGNTNKDLVVVSGKIDSGDSAILNGKTILIAGEVNLKGQVLDDLKIIAGAVNIDAEVLGNIEITAQRVSIGNNAKIKNDFVYFSPQRAQVSPSANIGNGLVYNQIETINENELIKKTFLNFVSFWSVIKFLATLFTAFILIFVFRMFSQRTSFFATRKTMKSILVGLFSILLIPVIVIILFASLFGIPISILMALIYFCLLVLVAPVSGIILGYFLQKIIEKNKKPEVNFNFTTLGIIIITFLYFIPYVGSIVRVFFLLLSFGAMVLYYAEIVTLSKRKNN